MDNSFFAYLQQLEAMAFFSGYPLLYAIILFMAGNQRAGKGIKSRMVSVLPFAYALVGTLYLGLQLKNLYPDYSFEHIQLSIQQPYLVSWGILSLLFWIPALSKKPVLSFIHSLVFFFLLVKDLVLPFFDSSADKHIVRNDMKIYTDSLFLNFGAFISLLLLYYLLTWSRKQLRP